MRSRPRGPYDGSANACVATIPTPASPQGTTVPVENQCDWTATPISPVSESRATIEYVTPCSMTVSMSVPTYERGLVQLSGSTYSFLQPDGGWGWANAGLIVGDDEAVLVDTFFDLANSREL